VTPKLDIGALRKAKAWEYLLRFVFGGAVTLCAGLVARRWGPHVGGLFLEFPAIFPASLTLVKEHDGRRKAAEDARGGRIGSLGLMAFACVVWLTARAWAPFAVLFVASVVWLVVDVMCWWLRYRHHDSAA